MTEAVAVMQLAFRATLRSHPIRAAWALAVLSALFAPFLVAFAFTGAQALAVEGALGTACLFAPAAALFAGIAFATGDRGGEGMAPVLRAAPGPATVLSATSAGIALAAALGSVFTVIVGLAAVGSLQPVPSAGAVLGPLAASLALAPAAAAAGLLLGILAPRALAATLGTLLLAALLAAPAGTLRDVLPRPEAFLLARDAAFGPLPARAVLLSAGSSMALAAAAVAGGMALLRGKDLAPRTEPT